VTRAEIEEMHARQAARDAPCPRGETIALPRDEGAATARALRALSDEQLARAVPIVRFGGRPTPAREIIEGILIGHVREHLANVRSSIGE
jgi:hypothetical protein